MRPPASALTLSLLLSALPLQSALAFAAEPAAKPSKVKKPKGAAKPRSQRPVSNSAWNAMLDKDVAIVSNGREFRGRLAGHDDKNVTLIEFNGAISDLPKSGITSLRAYERPLSQGHDTIERAPSRDPQVRQEETSLDAEEADGFRKAGAFVLLSPGILAFPIFSPEAVFYRWGISVGKFIPGESSNFAGAYGFTFEHMADRDRYVETYYDPYDPFYPAQNYDVTTWTHALRAMAEFRLGRSSERVFGYVLLGVGASMLRVTASVADVALNADVVAKDHLFGLNASLGGGLQGLIGRRFVLGFEPRFVTDFFFGDRLTMFDLRLILGAKF